MPENPVYPGQGSDTKETKTFFTESLSLSVDSKKSLHTSTISATGTESESLLDFPLMCLACRKRGCSVGAPSSGLQRVLQHRAGPACHGATVVEQPGEESDRSRGEVHNQIRQSCSLGPGDLIRPLQHTNV